MALPSTFVWEIRSAGSVNNGGAFVSGGSGTDWSQQNSPQYALTGVTTAAADAILLTASAASDMVDNGVKIVSGTNFTAGWYRVVSVVAGVSITLDRTCTTAAGSAGVVNVGGAIAAIANVSGVAVAGNILWSKGSFTRTASDVFASSGSATSPIQVIGYNSTRGDGYLGRDLYTGALVTTNYSTLAYNSTFKLNCTGTHVFFSCFIITGSVNSTSVVSIESSGTLRACKVTQNSTTSAYGIIGVNSTVTIVDCDVTLASTSGGLYAVYGTDTNFRVLGCRVNAVTGTGVLTASNGQVRGCTIFNCGSIGIQANTNTGTETYSQNTITGCTGDGIDLPTGSTTIREISNNMITDNGGYGIDANAATVGFLNINNRFRDNTSGNINGATGYVAATSWGQVTADGGAAISDYLSPGSNIYDLRPQSPAAYAGLPYPVSIGARQLPNLGDPPSRYRRQPN